MKLTHLLMSDQISRQEPVSRAPTYFLIIITTKGEIDTPVVCFDPCNLVLLFGLVKELVPQTVLMLPLPKIPGEDKLKPSPLPTIPQRSHTIEAIESREARL